jgi:hypothetical protein
VLALSVLQQLDRCDWSRRHAGAWLRDVGAQAGNRRLRIGASVRESPRTREIERIEGTEAIEEIDRGEGTEEIERGEGFQEIEETDGESFQKTASKIDSGGKPSGRARHLGNTFRLGATFSSPEYPPYVR